MKRVGERVVSNVMGVGGAMSEGWDVVAVVRIVLWGYGVVL